MAQQDVKFNIVANTQGMEAIAALINRVGALEAETNKLRTANAGLAASTDAVVRNGTRYNNAMDSQSKALRNARQGTQQLGMQINDFATSISTGASITQAFNQQIGQVGYAMSMMGGVAGKVGGFLAGPWGAAITVGTMVLSPLIESLFKTSDALKRIRDDAKDAISSLTALSKTSITENIAMAQSEMTTLVSEQSRLQGLIEKGGKFSFGRGQWTKELFAVNQQILTTQNAINQGNRALNEQQARADERAAKDAERKAAAAERAATAAERAADRIAAKAAKAAEALRKELGITANPITELQSKIATLRQMFDNGSVSIDEYRRAIGGLQADLSKAAGKPWPMMDAPAIAGPLDISEQVKNLTDSLPSIRGFTEEVQNAFNAVGMSVNDAFKGMLTAGMSWKDGMKGVIQSVIDELWRVFVVQQIVGMVSKTVGGMFGAPVSGGGSSAFNSAFAEFGTRAIGGSVTSNTPYLVGERGPELFVPGGNGTIIPNKNMGGGSSGNTISVNVDARGSSDPAAVRAQVQKGILEAAPAIIAAAEQRTINSIRRPRLGGAMQ